MGAPLVLQRIWIWLAKTWNKRLFVSPIALDLALSIRPPLAVPIAQWEIVQKRDSKEGESRHVEAIKYNRVAIGVLIALMLYAYLYLAGLVSYQGPSYGAQHQTIFAFFAFLILCVSDLTLEFLCLFQNSEPYPSQSHYFYDIIFRKTRNTVWMIYKQQTK